MTRLRLTDRLSETLPAGDYEVKYVEPAAGVIQLAPHRYSLGQKDKPQWDTLRRHPGVRIECINCGDWFEVADISVDEVRGWRCQSCRGDAAA